MYPCSYCGLAPLSHSVAKGELRALSDGTEIVCKEIAAL
ncbi:hypothetical protein PLUTE_a4309 [Pseudoalteromonas luteoviolacea DSM 6061]|nr:hypothetical protein [Pseudoalteromonas luteoviolacea DSM 6061]